MTGREGEQILQAEAGIYYSQARRIPVLWTEDSRTRIRYAKAKARTLATGAGPSVEIAQRHREAQRGLEQLGALACETLAKRGRKGA